MRDEGGSSVAGFIRGMLWGGVVAVGGLATLSQLSPPLRMPPQDEAALKAPLDSAGETPAEGETEALDRAAEAASKPVPDPASKEAPVPQADATAETAPAPGGEPQSEAGSQTEPGPSPMQPAPGATAEAPQQAPAGVTPETAAAGEAEMPSAVVPQVEADAPMGQGMVADLPADLPSAPGGTDTAAAPVAPEAAPPVEPAGSDLVAETPAQPQEAPVPPPTAAPEGIVETPAAPEAEAGVSAPQVADQPQAVAPAAPGDLTAEVAPDAAELPPPPPLTPEEEALLQPPETAPGEPLSPAPPPPSVLPPTPGLSDAAEGVITGRLPRIGAEEAPMAPGAETEDGAADAAVAIADLPPLARFARPFDNPDGKPLFSILLEDKGADVNRAELAAMDLPLNVVIDPLAEGAAERAAIWRAAGQEVVLSAASLPEGATPGDLEQIFQALATRLPEAVAVIDATGTGFQNNRALAAQIVPILLDQGRGLVSFDQGLNAADQVARREGLPAATIFRRFDLDNATGPAVKRYLDRAVFKAAQEGQVAVIAELRPETVAGLLEWTVEGRASTVAMAPISALLSR